jgi:hypothetical protein
MGASQRPIETAEWRAGDRAGYKRGFQAGLKEALRLIVTSRALGRDVPQSLDVAIMMLLPKGEDTKGPTKEDDADRTSKT